ncbi:MAG: nitroreductase [Clostridium sp.]|nr:nitroreductase [Clostridium sp.]
MLINEECYRKFKKHVEDNLERYSYYVISLETPGLGEATRWDKVYEKSCSPSDPTARKVIDDEYKRTLVNVIESVFDKLDNKSQKIIRKCYFEGNLTSPSEVMDEIKVNKNRYYELKKIALYKFMMAFGFC